MRSGWYVIARVDHWTAYLCGPFATSRAASASEEPVRRAAIAQHPDDPRYRLATYGIRKLTRNLKPGTLALDENYVKITLDDHRNNRHKGVIPNGS